MEDVNGIGLRLQVETLHLSLPQTKIRRQDDWTWRSTQGNKHRMVFLGIAEAVQPHVRSCAPTRCDDVWQWSFSGSSSSGVGFLNCGDDQFSGYSTVQNGDL